MSLYGPKAPPRQIKAAPKETRIQTRIRTDIERCQKLALNMMAQQAVLRYLTEFTISDGDKLVTFQREDLKYGATRWTNEGNPRDRFVLPNPRPWENVGCTCR